MPTQSRGDSDGTPLPPGGLRFRITSPSDLFRAERLRMRAGPALDGGRADIILVPSSQSPLPAAERSLKGPPEGNIDC